MYSEKKLLFGGTRMIQFDLTKIWDFQLCLKIKDKLFYISDAV